MTNKTEANKPTSPNAKKDVVPAKALENPTIRVELEFDVHGRPTPPKRDGSQPTFEEVFGQPQIANDVQALLSHHQT